MATTVEIQELPGRFGELVAQAAAGTDVIVTEHNVPRARLLPLPPVAGQARVPGLHPGTMQMADDFDAPLPDDFWLGAT